MINEGKGPVSTETFVITEINTDDPASDEAFLKKFGRDNFGDTLPFVVITDSKAKALASYSSYKKETDVTPSHQQSLRQIGWGDGEEIANAVGRAKAPA